MTVTMSNTLPKTAKQRGRPKGATKQLGKDFLSWPLDTWVTKTFEDSKETLAAARHLRNLGWRKGIGVKILTDSESEVTIHVLKFNREHAETDGVVVE